MKSSIPDTWLFPSRRRKYCDLDLVNVDFFLSVWLLAGKNLRFVRLDFWPLRFRASFWFFWKSLPAEERRQQISGLTCKPCFRLPICCHSSFLSKSQCLSPLLTGEPNWTESCWKDLLVPCLEQSRIHHFSRPSAKWRVGQHANFQKTDVLLTGRMVSERSPNRVMPYRVKRRFENRPFPPRCLFTFTAFSNNESVRH